jgi:hypothetical protein
MNLRAAARSEPAGRSAAIALREIVRQAEADEDASGWAQLGFQIVAAGFSALSASGVRLHGPTGEIGVRLPNKPNLDYQWVSGRRTVVSYRSQTLVGIETANIQLRCDIRYNGPEVVALFGFAPGGRRARLGAEAEIWIRGALPLRTVPTGPEWQAVGIRRYPVIEIPIEVMVDEPWPNSNHEETFNLVLSGMQGFGAPGLPVKRLHQVRRT